MTQQKRRQQEVWPQPIRKRLRDQLQWTESLPLLACKTSLLNHYPLIMLEAQHRCGSFPISGGKSEQVVMQARPKTSPAVALSFKIKRNKKYNLSLKEQPISWKIKQVVRTNTRAAQTHTSCADFVPWPVQPGPKSPPRKSRLSRFHHPPEDELIHSPGSPTPEPFCWVISAASLMCFRRLNFNRSA